MAHACASLAFPAANGRWMRALTSQSARKTVIAITPTMTLAKMWPSLRVRVDVLLAVPKAF